MLLSMRGVSTARLLPAFNRSNALLSAKRPAVLVLHTHKTAAIRAFSSYPDHEVVGLPALSPTMEAGAIGAWNVKEGDSFEAGDVIAEIETDKATMGFEAQDPGVVAKILIQPGNEVAVGKPIMIIVDDADDGAALVSAFKDFTVDAAPAAAPAAAAPAPAPAAPVAPAAPPPAAAAPPTPAPGAAGGERVFASPLARKMARESGYDISAVPPTGPRGRVVAADVAAFKPAAAAAVESAAAAPAAGEAFAAGVAGDGYVDYPVSEASREVAARMVLSKQQVPHYYLTVDIELGSLMAARAKLNESLGPDEQLTANDLLLKAAALAMKAVPDVNASWMDTFVRSYERCDVNVVVGVGDGLVAPVLKDAGNLGLKQISDQVRAAVAGASEGTLPEEAYQVGTFTVVNLGMYGVKSAAPIVTMPQAAVLALGAIEEKVLPNDDPGSEQIYRLADVVTATCSFDHRVVDGAVGAQWLAAYKKLVENPLTMLL